jgi:integrase/recombinase XerD
MFLLIILEDNFKIINMENPKSYLVELFIKEMQLRNYSNRTIETYSKALFAIEKYCNKTIDNITTEEFKAFLHHRITIDEISVSLINQHISAYKILQTDIFKREWEPIKVKRPRRTKKLPVILSMDEVERLIAVTKNIKHKALLMLTYSSGLRLQELQNIKPSAIDSARMQVHIVQGKGKKDRYSILSFKTLEILRFYYKTEKPSCFLFETQLQKGRKLSATTLGDIVKNSAKKAGIKKQVSFHTLRHCFATHLLEKGVNLRLIQQLMGHVSLKTTAGYLHLVNINPASVVSPLDSMNI